MKEIRPVSQEEMEQKFPDLMEALSDPSKASYCMNCDGLRTHTTEECPFPDPYANPPPKRKFGDDADRPEGAISDQEYFDRNGCIPPWSYE